MADVVLKNRQGVSKTYEGVESVALKTPDGGEEIFSKGGGGSLPAVVTLTWSDDDGAYLADLTCAEIWDLFQAGKRVNVKFEVPGYEGFLYEAPIAVFGHGEGESAYFYEVQQLDPFTSALMCLYINGSEGNIHWSLTAINLGS